MPGFTKLFSSITASTVWMESDQTRLVWITMLALADKYGRVMASVPGLSHISRISLEDTRAAIDKFLSPDPDSRSPAEDGRRIDKIDGGWQLVNYSKYRELRDEDERREYKARKEKEYRAKRSVDRKRGQTWTNVEPVDSRGHNAEAEAYTEANAKEQKPSPRRKRSEISDDRHTPFRQSFEKYYSYKNPYLEAPWDAQEATQLSRWLKKNPKINLADWQAILRHRAKSPKETQSANLSAWISRALSFHEKPIGENGNGGFKSNAEKRQDFFIETLNQRGGRASVPELAGGSEAGANLEANGGSLHPLLAEIRDRGLDGSHAALNGNTPPRGRNGVS